MKEPRLLLIGEATVASRAGGMNRYLEALLDSLREHTSVHAVVVGDGNPERGIIGVGRARNPLVSRLYSVCAAAQRLARTTDVVDAHFALYALLPITVTRLRHLPVVVHFQGPWADESAVGRGQRKIVVGVKRRLEQAVYRRAEVVVVLSQQFGRLVVERYGVEPHRVVVVPPGVDLERFHQGDQATARAHFGLPPSGFVAITVRRLDARMGLDVLLDAWSAVQAARDDALLLIAGDGRERERLEALRHRLPNPSGVRFLGRISDDDLVKLYQAADISVVPTRALEGFGLVTLESLACGTPPIVTDVGGLPDGVRGLDLSLVVRPEAPDALADRIVDAAKGIAPSPMACRAHAEAFAWDVVAQRHLDLFRQAEGMGRMRVAYVDHTAELSGGELALARTLSALAAVDAHVLLAEDGPLVERLRTAGAAVEVLPLGERTRSLRRGSVTPRKLPFSALLETASYTLRLARRFRRLRPDVVHTNTLKAALYGGIAGRLAGIPVVWHVRDRITPDYLPRPAISLIRIASRLIPAVVVANSQATLATLGWWPRSAVVVPSPVESPSSSHAAIHEDRQRAFTVGLVGRLAPWKGQDVFLRAFASAFAGGEERALIVGSAMFGENDWADSLPALAKSLGISDQVEFTGFIEDVGSLYRQMDVLVHASTIPEPLGQVVLEGMAAGLPVVATGTGGPAEIITDGLDGFLYPMGDQAALVDRLRQLADDSELRSGLGRNGRQRAQVFAPARIAVQIEDVYRRVVRRRGRWVSPA